MKTKAVKRGQVWTRDPAIPYPILILRVEDEETAEVDTLVVVYLSTVEKRSQRWISSYLLENYIYVKTLTELELLLTE